MGGHMPVMLHLHALAAQFAHARPRGPHPHGERSSDRGVGKMVRTSMREAL